MHPTEQHTILSEKEDSRFGIEVEDDNGYGADIVNVANGFYRNKDNNKCRNVSRSGMCTMNNVRTSRRIHQFSRDIFTSMVECSWSTLYLIFAVSLMASLLLFALLWWIIAYAHGDLATSHHHLNQSEACVSLVTDFMNAFLFSVESQYTIGYGSRVPTTECPEAIFLIFCQSIFGFLYQSVMIGFIFTKLCHPKRRMKAILFSEKAVICVRDGTLCFTFRLADELKSNVMDCKIHAWFVQHEISKEGDVLLNRQRKLKISVDEGGSEIFLLWPVNVVHRIDKESALYHMSSELLYSSKFEIIVSLVCTTVATGRPTEVRCSYTPNEILWAHRFQCLFNRTDDGFEADYGLLNKTEPIDMLPHSAKQLDSRFMKQS